MSKRVTLLGRSRRNFFTGLAVVLPVIISIGVALWLFNQAVAVSDILLFPSKYIPGLELEHIWKDAVDGQPGKELYCCLLYTSPSPRDATLSRMPSSA